MSTTFFAVVTKAGLDEIALAVGSGSTIDFAYVSVGDSLGATESDGYYEPGSAIAHFSDNGSGGTTVTLTLVSPATNHGLPNGTTINIYSTTNYNGNHAIFNAAGTSFDIPVPFTLDDATGNWTVVDLMHENFRRPPNAVYVHPDNANWVVIEGIIPAASTGRDWFVKEVGVWTARGDFFAAGKYPASYLPDLPDGSGKDLYIRLVLVVSPISVINLIIDPNVVLATQQYVKDYACWATRSDRIIDNVFFEPDVVQDDVVYFNGLTQQFGRALAGDSVRRNAIGFADVTNSYVYTHNEYTMAADVLTSGSVYYLSLSTPGAITNVKPASEIIKVGTAQKTNEMLIDIQDLSAAFTGEIRMYGGSVAPLGWLVCDGSSISRATYATLFAVIGSSYGDGDHVNTFNLPDFRSRGPVGAGTGTGGGANGSGLPTGGSALTTRNLGDWTGEEVHTLITLELPSHAHKLQGTFLDGVVDITNFAAGASSPEPLHGLLLGNGAYGNVVNQSQGGGGAHNNVQPVMTVNFIIRY